MTESHVVYLAYILLFSFSCSVQPPWLVDDIMALELMCCRYNFHLFPRDELNLGMPSYNFSCQTSFLTSMAREGFDFNAFIYDGEHQFGCKKAALSFQKFIYA